MITKTLRVKLLEILKKLSLAACFGCSFILASGQKESVFMQDIPWTILASSSNQVIPDQHSFDPNRQSETGFSNAIIYGKDGDFTFIEKSTEDGYGIKKANKKFAIKWSVKTEMVPIAIGKLGGNIAAVFSKEERITNHKNSFSLWLLNSENGKVLEKKEIYTTDNDNKMKQPLVYFSKDGATVTVGFRKTGLKQIMFGNYNPVDVKTDYPFSEKIEIMDLDDKLQQTSHFSLADSYNKLYYLNSTIADNGLLAFAFYDEAASKYLVDFFDHAGKKIKSITYDNIEKRKMGYAMAIMKSLKNSHDLLVSFESEKDKSTNVELLSKINLDNFSVEKQTNTYKDKTWNDAPWQQVNIFGKEKDIDLNNYQLLDVLEADGKTIVIKQTHHISMAHSPGTEVYGSALVLVYDNKMKLLYTYKLGGLMEVFITRGAFFGYKVIDNKLFVLKSYNSGIMKASAMVSLISLADGKVLAENELEKLNKNAIPEPGSILWFDDYCIVPIVKKEGTDEFIKISFAK